MVISGVVPHHHPLPHRLHLHQPIPQQVPTLQQPIPQPTPQLTLPIEEEFYNLLVMSQIVSLA